MLVYRSEPMDFVKQKRKLRLITWVMLVENGALEQRATYVSPVNKLRPWFVGETGLSPLSWVIFIHFPLKQAGWKKNSHI